MSVRENFWCLSTTSKYIERVGFNSLQRGTMAARSRSRRPRTSSEDVSRIDKVFQKNRRMPLISAIHELNLLKSTIRDVLRKTSMIFLTKFYHMNNQEGVHLLGCNTCIALFSPMNACFIQIELVTSIMIEYEVLRNCIWSNKCLKSQ